MSLNFPSSPTNGQTFTTSSGVTYRYNGTSWVAINSSYAIGGFRKLDDISSGFNGTNTTFTLSVSGTAVAPASAQNLIVVIGGIPQEPINAYTIANSSILFTSAPTNGMTFYGVLLGDVMNVGVPSDNTISTSKITDSAITSAKIADYSVVSSKIANTITMGAVTASSLDITGISNANNIIVSGTVKIPSSNIASGTVGQIRYNQTSGAFEGYSSGWNSLGGLILQSVQTSNFTAVAGYSYPVNTSNNSVTVTLPASPTAGQQINIFDYAGTAAANNITLNPNGLKINGVAVAALISTTRASVTLVYVDTTQGWIDVAIGNATYLAQSYSISYLVVAGGGGAGYAGGGAGGLLTGSQTLNAGTGYTITIGGGGAGVQGGNTPGSNGSNSVFSTVTAKGGGAGGVGTSAGVNGGSGGGGSCASAPSGGSGTSGQGYAGGTGTGTNGVNQTGGGGGGAGAVGGNASGTTGGAGGSGFASSITGSSVTYAGGGGGGSISGGSGGAGGAGGGGAGGTIGGGVGGSINTGSGGGGAGVSGGATGGSGVVILSVPTQYYTGNITGSPTITTSGSNTIIKFTSSGSYTA